MIIVHENLTEEAERVAKAFKEVYGFDSKIVNKDLTEAFTKIAKFEGFLESFFNIGKFLSEYGNKKVMVITPKDIYADATSQDDDWIFGYCAEEIILASTARLKCFDSKPSEILEVPKELYMKRLESLAIHEIGHDVVKANHFQLATWVNTQTNHQLWLGPHCTDNTCVMYEIVDIRAPPKEEGYMLLGEEKKYDAGLDDVLKRISPEWFCSKCKSTIKIDESYR